MSAIPTLPAIARRVTRLRLPPVKQNIPRCMSSVPMPGVSSTCPWPGVKSKLLRKTTLVHASAEHLPVHTLTFEMPEHAIFPGRGLAHRDIRVDIGDVVKVVIPGYKPKSYSIHDLREGDFDVTYKVYPNGRASGYLDSLRVGDTVKSFGFNRALTRNPGSYVGIVAFGVGITEALPIAEAELGKGDAELVTLLWASRTIGDTFWLDKIEHLSGKYGEKFQLTHILSREERDGCLLGRINPFVLDTVFQPPHRDQARFLSVGTKEMMQDTEEMLQKIGYTIANHKLLPK